MAEPKLPEGFTLKKQPTPPAGFQLKGTTPQATAKPSRPQSASPKAYAREPGGSGGQGGVFGPAADVAAGLWGQFVAGVQGTSPVVQSMTGKMNYQKLGSFDPGSELGLQGWFEDDAGKPRYLDTSAMVVLLDPESGGYSVYARSPETDESLLPSLGRVLGLGAMTAAPTRLPGLVKTNEGMIPWLGRVASVPQLEKLGEVRLNAAVEAARTYQRAGVPETMGGVGGRGMKIVHNAARQFPPTAGAVHKADVRSINTTGTKLAALGEKLGTASTPQRAGAELRRGAQEFMTNFDAKADELYKALDAAVPGNTIVRMSSTIRYLQKVGTRFNEPQLVEEFTDPKIKKWAAAIARGGGVMTWNDVRQLRTEIGKLLRKPVIREDFDRGQLEAFYAALSEDLGTTAKGVGAGRIFERADGYYSAGLKRINGALKEILKPDATGEDAYAALMRAAQEGVKGDRGKLLAIQRSMPADEWGDVAATILQELGKPRAGQAGGDMAFSPSTFLTRYAGLSDEAKTVLFSKQGNHQLRQALDDLVKVAGYQKEVEKLANTSNTGGVVTTGGLFAGALAAPVTTILSALGANLGARALFSPGMVRWMAGASRIQPKQWPKALNNLSLLARNDPELRQFATALQHAFAGQNPPLAGEGDWRASDSTAQ